MKDFLSQSHEEIQNAIKDYNKTFNLLKTSQISSILKFQQVKAVSRVSSSILKRQIISKSTITPNLSSYRIPNFHSQLSIIAKSKELKLKILPTLVLGRQPYLLLNDSKGLLKLIEKKNILNTFLGLGCKESALILKSDSSKPRVIRNYNEFEKNNKNFLRSEGILQHFMESPKIAPLLRAVVGKDGNYKLFLLEDLRQRDKSKGKKMAGGLLGRLKERKLIEMVNDEDDEMYYINELTMNNLSINPFSMPDNDLKLSILTLKYLVEKFMISRHKLSSVIFDFIKDPSGQWSFLSCPCVKLEKIQYKELYHSFTLPEEILPDLELSSNTESTFYIPVEQTKPKESLKYQRSNSYFSYSNIIDTFNESLGDKFRRVMNKLDNIKSSKKIPLHFASKSDLIQDYKAKFKLTQNSSNKFPIKRLDSGDNAGGGKDLIKSVSKVSTAESDNIERNSRKRNFFTPNGIFDDNTKHHLRNFGESLTKFDLVMVNLNNSKLATTNFILKYGQKFANIFFEELGLRIGNNEGLVNQMNELRCPGMASILNCKYCIEYEKKVRELHKPLLISDVTYSELSECVISTLNFLKVSQDDVNLTQNLLTKLRKHIVSI